MRDERLRTTILRLFLVSGCSGLMYQVVWLRMLARMFGVTIYATSTVVAAFMGGLALGSFLFGRAVDRTRNPLRLYAILEFGIAGAALLVPVLLALTLPLIRVVAQASGGMGAAIAGVRVVIAFLVLLLPTTLMGGTLPVLTSFLTRRATLFGQGFAMLYSLNTAGAVFGVLLSGFVTIGHVGERATVWIAGGLNVLVATVAWLIARRLATPESGMDALDEGTAVTGTGSKYSRRIQNVVLVAFALSGFTALAYEIIWTRQLILFLETSIYAFSGMLAVFLVGLGIGSLLISRVVDRLRQPLLVFAMLELAVAVISVLSLRLYVPLDGAVAGRLLGPAKPLVATLVLVLPLTFLFGLITPVAAVAFGGSTRASGSVVGRVYSANTVGSIVGALMSGFLLIPLLGGTGAVLALAAANLAIGVILLTLDRGTSARLRLGWALGALVIVVLGARGLHDPFREAIESRIARKIGVSRLPSTYALLAPTHRILYYREGLEATTTAFEVNTFKELWVNGVGMTVLTTATKLMAHIPLAMSEDPRNVLVIAFGMGTTARSASRYPGVEVTAVDIVPETFQAFRYYHADGEALLRSGRVQTVADDGRNFLLLSPKKYDVITVDPAPPTWSAGTVNLYTREFFQLARAHLTSNGVFCLWFPEATDVEVKGLLASLVEVFPNAAVWDGPNSWGWYFIGTQRPIDWVGFRRRLRWAFANPVLAADIVEFDSLAGTPERVEAMYKWDGDDVRAQTAGAKPVTDDYPLTEFPLWRYARGDSLPWHPEGQAQMPRTSNPN